VSEAEAVRAAFAPPPAADPELRARQAADPYAKPHRGLPRALDVAIAALGLVVLAPVLAIAAAAIRFSSPGPVIYRQRRVGLGEQEFELLKLRTMAAGSDPVGVGTAVGAGDPRVTRAGALLRRTSLDEVPNLVNVLRGEMSIIGPRPTVPVQVDRYTERQRGRLAVKPGITGWAQVNGRTELPWDERIELDLWYIEHRSLRLDVEILRRTVRMVLGGQGLYRGEMVVHLRCRPR
jgi:lipopolysaccharide/colanic/teichoic acid biosynthesis glycosyltransferase